MFTTIYNINHASYEGWTFDFVSISILLIVGIILTIIAKKIYKTKTITIIKFTVPIFVIILPIIIVTNLFKYYDFKKLKNAFNKNETIIVEGYVRNVKLEHGRIEKQYFSVNNVDFIISDNIYTGGFNKTIQNGGPIREGLYVRINYYRKCCYENIIVRLEIRK